MNKKTIYKPAPEEVREALDSSVEIKDFLPPPELLIPREKAKKITITLSQKSIDFFKEASLENNVPYQQLIRKVLDTYTDYYSGEKRYNRIR